MKVVRIGKVKDVSIARDQVISPENALKTAQIYVEDPTVMTEEAEIDTTGKETIDMTDQTGILLIYSGAKETETTAIRTDTNAVIVVTEIATEMTIVKEIVTEMRNVDIVKDLIRILNLNPPLKAVTVVMTVKINKENKKEDAPEVEQAED